MSDNRKYPKKVMISEIIDFLDLERLTGDEKSLNRWVVVPDVNRPGFELMGYVHPTEPRRVVIIGNKESEYIQHMSETDQRERFKSITDGLTPMIIITRNNELPPILKEMAEAVDFPIYRTGMPTWELMVDLISFLDEKLAVEETISGDLVQVYGQGVLIIGESGMGKSECALELLRDNQVLISDDRVDVMKFHNHLEGHAPDLLRGMIEIRGIGIIDAERMFGAGSIAASSSIDMVIQLVKYDSQDDYTRIGDEVIRYTRILNELVPTLQLPISAGRSMRALVETAVSNHILKEQGYNSAEKFKERLHTTIEKDMEAGK